MQRCVKQGGERFSEGKRGVRTMGSPQEHLSYLYPWRRPGSPSERKASVPVGVSLEWNGTTDYPRFEYRYKFCIICRR